MLEIGESVQARTNPKLGQRRPATVATSLPKSSELKSSKAPLYSPLRQSLGTQPARFSDHADDPRGVDNERLPLLLLLPLPRRRALGLLKKINLERLAQSVRILRAVERSLVLADAGCRRSGVAQGS